MSEERIMTLHPEGKKGVNILKDKYLVMKDTIVTVLKEENETTFDGLISKVKDKLANKFKGSIGWYATTVKLDLEARNTITCTRGSGPQVIKLNK
jgi:hypothetical protein